MAKSNHTLRVVPTPESEDETGLKKVSVPKPLQEFLGDLICRIDRIDGVIGLAKEAVLEEAGTNERLSRSWCAIGFALKELARVRNDIDCAERGMVTVPDRAA